MEISATPTIDLLSQALKTLMKLEETQEIDLPASFYHSLKSACELRSVDKRKLSVLLSDFSGNDLLIELARANRKLTDFLPASPIGLPQPNTTMQPQKQNHPTYASITNHPMPSQPRHQPQSQAKPMYANPQRESFFKSRAILRFDPPWPHYHRPEKSQLTHGLNETLSKSGAPDTTRIAAVSFTKGGHVALFAAAT
ncbi:hypothetical protein FRB90_006609, partial [Tulasnella sp. 427]